MSRFFAFLRQDLRASLIPSLLVLGHALLLTAVKARESPFSLSSCLIRFIMADVSAAQESRTDELTSALGTTSALISITILWVTFTILEALDSRLFTRWAIRRKASTTDESEGEEEEDEVLVFCMTCIELSLGLMLLSAWICKLALSTLLTGHSLSG